MNDNLNIMGLVPAATSGPTHYNQTPLERGIIMRTKIKKFMHKYAFKTNLLMLMVLIGIVLFLDYRDKDIPSALEAQIPPIIVDKNQQDVEDLKFEFGQLKVEYGTLQNRYSQMKDEITWFRSQLAEQKEPGIPILNQTETTPSFNTLEEPESEKSQASLQEDAIAEEERIAARMIAQEDLLEDTVISEEIDSQWSRWAEDSLIETLESDEAHGFYVADLDCRTTLCRMELTSDASISPEESFRYLSLLSPWTGERFVSIGGFEEDDESPLAVVYLSRDGYKLPQHLTE
jgi:hypothetical protein